MMESNDRQAMLINSCGPFTHGHYSWNGVEISHEGPLKGRADLLASRACELVERLTPPRGRLKSDLRILDVGSYDGWILNQLYFSGYTNLFGLEPRRQNIVRGFKIREILGMEDTAKHFEGTLQKPGELGGELFDVILCFGVIHHINDIVGFIRDIRDKLMPGGRVLIECLTLDDQLVNSSIASALEPKDLIYQDLDREVSLIGVKLESNYYPGSSDATGTVQIPARQALVWFLEFNGFEVNSVESGWEEQNRPDMLSRTQRKEAKSTIIEATAKTSAANPSAASAISDYEEAFTLRCLSSDVIGKLELIIALNSEPYSETLLHELSVLSQNLSSDAASIVMALIHAPETKLLLEKAKTAALMNNLEEANKYLLNIVTTISDDWRTTYRAFNLLQITDTERSCEYVDLARRCNPEFPEEILLKGLSWVDSNKTPR